MYTEVLENNLKEEMKKIIDNLSFANLENSKEHIEHYFSFLSDLANFHHYRKKHIIEDVLSSLTTPTTKSEEQKTEIEEQPFNNEIIDSYENSVENHNTKDTMYSEVEERKMYRFERKIKAGCLPEISAYVPESIIRNLNLEHNCYLYAEELGDEEGRFYSYQLAKESDDPFCPGRIQVNFCPIEKQDSFLIVRKSYESGSDIKINDVSYSILIKDSDITEFKLREGDIVDIAFPEGKPEEVKVLWVHRDFSESNLEQNTSSIKISKNKNKQVLEQNREQHLMPTTLTNKTILIIGNEPDKASYKKMIEERGGTFLWSDSKESTVRLEAQVRKSDMVIFLLKVSGHTGMDKIKEFCKDYNIPFLTTFSLGKSTILKMAEEYGPEKEVI